jgi:hypothetical protein
MRDRVLRQTNPRRDRETGLGMAVDKTKKLICCTDLHPWCVPVGEVDPRKFTRGDVITVDLSQAKDLTQKGFFRVYDADLED